MLRALRQWQYGLLAVALMSTGALAPIAGEEKEARESKTADDPQAIDRDSDDYYKLLRLFADTLDQVDRNYVKEIDRSELIEAAIEGMLSKLDQHSDYIPSAEIESFRGQVDNEFGGIGVQVSIEDGELMIISPVYGSPAYRQGVLSGDVITKINGESAKDLTLENAVRLMKGKIGTDVDITVRHPDGEEKDITIRRSVIRLETVLGNQRKDNDSWDFFLDRDQKIGYIRLNAFSRFTSRDLRRALNELYDEDVQALILDLRFNPGGLLASAIQICDFFVSEGRIVSTEGRNTEPQVWDARSRGTYASIPIAVLINRYSASASEIVSACLKDNGKAVVVGGRSFGKGSVQNVIDLEGGESALKLTTASYYRPNGKNIHREQGDTEDDEWGVKPSDGFEVKMSQREMRRYLLDRQERDLLKSADEQAEPFKDKQLEKALEYVLSAVKSTNREAETTEASTDGEAEGEVAKQVGKEKKSEPKTKSDNDESNGVR